MITDRELARYISSNLHLYLADEDKPVECKVVDVSKNNGGTVAGVQILMLGIQSPFIRWMKVCMIRIANSLNLNSLNLEWRRIMDWFTKRNR